MSARHRKPSTATEIVEETVKEAEQKIANALTVLWNDLPGWQQDNYYILTGYRPASFSFQKSFSSLFYLHNESVNIYSHYLGAIFFTLLSLYLYHTIPPRYATSTKSDIYAFSSFFLGAALCLGMSGTYHTISNHSHTVARWGNKLDYVGIICLITGSFIPSVYYGFYCRADLRRVYWSMIGTLGLGCTAVSVFNRFRTPAWRPWRAAMFVALGLSALFPVIHGIKIYGVEEMRGRIGLVWVILQGVLYIVGAGLYAARYPERSSPGKYDIWGSSHQIFHVLVILAAAAHLWGLCKAFDYHHREGGIKC